MRYATIDDAIRLIKSLGKGCFLAKTDISPNDFPLLGMEWQGKFYFDKCLLMGCSLSCNIFETFSTASEWIAMNKLNASAVIYILDDFLFIAPSKEICQGDLDNFLTSCQRIGIPIANEKTMGPDRALQSAGITLDTESMEVRLPEIKLTNTYPS